MSRRTVKIVAVCIAALLLIGSVAGAIVSLFY
jgi:hypothetical protein